MDDPAAFHHQQLAGHEVAVGAGEEKRGSGDVLGYLDAFEGRRPALSDRRLRISSVITSSLMVEPGVMQFTLMFQSPSCRDMTRVSATTPPLELV